MKNINLEKINKELLSKKIHYVEPMSECKSLAEMLKALNTEPLILATMISLAIDTGLRITSCQNIQVYNHHNYKIERKNMTQTKQQAIHLSPEEKENLVDELLIFMKNELENGRVKDVKAVNADEEFVEAIVDRALNCVRIEQTTDNGKPIEMRFNIPVTIKKTE